MYPTGCSRLRCARTSPWSGFEVCAASATQGEVQRVGGKLSNAAFVDKAPPAVIEKERAKLAESEQALANFTEQHARIAAL